MIGSARMWTPRLWTGRAWPHEAATVTEPPPPFDGPLVLKGASANQSAVATNPSFLAVVMHGTVVTARTYRTWR